MDFNLCLMSFLRLRISCKLRTGPNNHLQPQTNHRWIKKKQQHEEALDATMLTVSFKFCAHWWKIKMFHPNVVLKWKKPWEPTTWIFSAYNRYFSGLETFIFPWVVGVQRKMVCILLEFRRFGSNQKSEDFERLCNFPLPKAGYPVSGIQLQNPQLDGGFKYFLFSPLFGEDSHFD